MGNFSEYGEKVNEIAEAAFEEYNNAAAAYERAEAQRRLYPQRGGMINAEYAAKSARAEADFLEAKEAFDKAKRIFRDHNDEIATLRKQLAAEIDSHYAADPGKLDNNTLELLKSGILKPDEYARLLNTALDKDNYTMARLISKYANNAAAEVAKQYGEYSEQARELRAVAREGRQLDGSEILDTFDILAEVFYRTSNNPAMMKAWGELTDRAIAAL